MGGKNAPHLSLASLFIVIAVQIGGFALLWSKDAPPPKYVYLPATADKTTTDSAVNTPLVIVSPPDEKALREIIQIVLKQELSGYIQTVGTTKTATRNEDQVQENTPANAEANTQVSTLIDSAISKQVWTHEDTARLAPYSGQLSMAQREMLLRKIAEAVNNQQLVLHSMPLGL